VKRLKGTSLWVEVRGNQYRFCNGVLGREWHPLKEIVGDLA